jgi:exosortase C (VPDSG-CTERM-specific)
VPFPAFLEQAIESFLQHASAEGAELLFGLVGTSFYRDGLVFSLPGIAPFKVARECSGIHSTLVLFITSFVAGQLFLRSSWKRLVLVLCVIPLGIVRNGFRILTIGELCLHVSPRMMYSPIHTHGGPIFFALSLVPFLLLLYFLRKSDLQKVPPTVFRDEL